MLDLLATNIRKSINQLNATSSTRSYELMWPVFCGTKQRLTCDQADFFGFYVLAGVIRSLMRAVNFVVASYSTLESGLLAPSIALSYTGAFHGLMTHLALEGRPHVESFGWAKRQSDADSAHVDQPDELPIIAAILTVNNTWSFECRTLSHKARWREIAHLFGKRGYVMPQCFRDLFRYMFQGRQKERIPLKDILADPSLLEANQLQFEDAIDEFLDRIANVRHTALYRAFGEDPRVVDAMWNDEAPSMSGIEDQAAAFCSFSQAILSHVSSDTTTLISSLSPSADLRNALRVSIYLPGLDEPRIDDLTSEVPRSQLCLIDRWLKQ